jgi:hypothetical protein
MSLTVEAPLACPLLLGLWCEADDAGTFEWKPLTIKARILPAASPDVNQLLAALVSADVIKQFEIDGKQFGVIRNFVKFQRPKEPKVVHPSSPESLAYAGFEANGARPRSGTGRPPGTTSEPLPKSPGSPSEESCQREDVGGRMEDEGGNHTRLASLMASLRRPRAAAAEPKKAKRAVKRLDRDFGQMRRSLLDAACHTPEKLELSQRAESEFRSSAIRFRDSASCTQADLRRLGMQRYRNWCLPGALRHPGGPR